MVRRAVLIEKPVVELLFDELGDGLRDQGFAHLNEDFQQDRGEGRAAHDHDADHQGQGGGPAYGAGAGVTWTFP